MHRPRLVDTWQGLWLRTYIRGRRRHVVHEIGLYDHNKNIVLGLVVKTIGKAYFVII